jgi:hypothetical protein
MGEADAQNTWVKAKTKDWANAILELTLVADRYPQAAYAGLQKSLQAEWQFLQQLTDGLGNEFLEIEKRLSQEFLPALFGVDNFNKTHKLGLAIPNPTATAENIWTALTEICGHLVTALQGREEFRLADHTAIMAFGKAEVRRWKTVESEASLDYAILQELDADKSRTIRR